MVKIYKKDLEQNVTLRTINVFYRNGAACTDQVFTVRFICEKYLANGKFF